MLVDISASQLLSGKVSGLAAEKLDAQQELAEALLDLTAEFVARLSAAQLPRVQMAVALQLNFQVEQGLDPFVMESTSSQTQGESVTYRADSIHPQAQAIVKAIELVDDSSTQMVQAFAAIPAVRSNRTVGSGGNPSTPYRP